MSGIQVSVQSSDARGLSAHLEAVFCSAPTVFVEDAKDRTRVFHSVRTVHNRPFAVESKGTEYDLATGVFFYLEVDDAVAVEKRAVAAGAVTLVPVAMAAWGALYGAFRDPAGVVWALGQGQTRPEAVPFKDMRSVVPEIAAKDARAEIDWIVGVFAGEVLGEVKDDGAGNVMHAELLVNKNGLVYVSSQFGEESNKSEVARICITVEAEPGAGAALAASLAQGGGEVTMPVAPQFWGDVYGRLTDRFGLEWAVIEAQHALREFPGCKVLGREGANLEMGALQKFCGSAIPASLGRLKELGVAPSGPITSMFTAFRPFDLKTGAQISDDLPDQPEHDLKTIAFPRTGPCAYTVLRGPYEKLPEAWAGLHRWADKMGIALSKPAFEVYHQDDSVPRTEIFCRIESGGSADLCRK